MIKIKYLIISILFASNISYSHSRDLYPEWFLFPCRYPGIIVGFSLHGKLPNIDAEIMYCVFKKCLVNGYLETYEINHTRYYKNSEYYYIYSKELLGKIKGQLHHLDGFCYDVLAEEYVSAFSLNPEYVLNPIRVNIKNLSSPDWIKNSTWEEKGFYYSVGMFTSMSNKNDAWKTSEEQAIFNLLTMYSIKSFSLLSNSTITFNNVNINKHINYFRMDVNFLLENIIVLERWPDEEHQLFYTLIKVKKENVLSFYDELNNHK